MRYSVLTSLLLSFFISRAQDPLPPVGEWREHLPYQSAIDLSAGDGKLYCATPYSLFSVDVSGTGIERYSRVSGLNETGISAIRYDEAGHKLIIAYTNSNIDILFRNDIYNVPDIKQDNITGDKTIYNIYPLGNDFYLSTGLAVVVVDGTKYEVRDSWFIGNGGNPVRVNGFTSDAGFFYAATAEGLKKLPLNSPNPANYANWQMVSGSNGLSAGPCQQVMSLQNRIVLQKNDSLFVQNGNTWSLLYADGWSLVSSTATENKIQLCEKQGASSRVILLNADGSLSRNISAPVMNVPRRAIILNGNPWVADSLAGLLRYDAGNIPTTYVLNSPASTGGGDLLVAGNRFLAASGAVNGTWSGQGVYQGLSVLSEGKWENYNRKTYPVFDSLPDLFAITVDRRDETIWTGSFGGGLLHIKPGPVFELFKQNYLGPFITDPASFRVAGLAFDADHNLWVSNYGAVQPLRVRKADGNWKAFTVPPALAVNTLAQLVIGDNNFKWIVCPPGNGLLCFDAGASVDNTGDDRWRKYGMGSGNGNLPSADVICVAKDKNGFIWAGTADGIGVIQCPEQAFDAQGCDAIWPVVPAGNFAGYLFKGQEVRSIAVDGADRKWVATRNGAFLVSAEGEKLIYRFTEDNSPLLSSDVKKITIDGSTGEVFFATAKGICSFRGTATEGGEKNEEVLVFPNPVPPGFSGTIAIRGLVNNAVVKITELDGRLVFQTRALGGQAVWDGRNYRGDRVASGAYLVLVSDDGTLSVSGKRERIATKIFFIGR